MRILQIQYLLLIIVAALTGVSCNDSNSTGPGVEPATVEGRVEDEGNNQNKSSAPVIQTVSVEGATVTAARITAEGSLETIPGAEATTNAQGEFFLNINADAVANSGRHIVVVAEKNSRQWKTFITGELKSGSTVVVQPLTEESSGEADVFTGIVAEGNTNLVSKADIEAFVDAGTSAAISSNAGAAAIIAGALAAGAQARSKYFTNQSIEITEEQKNNILETKALAQAELESKLNATTSEAQHQAAMDVFMEAVAHAYVDAGVDASAYARAKELSGLILLKNCTSISSEARSEIRSNAALLASYAINTAVQAKMEAANAAGQSVQAAAQAGAQLRSDIKAVANASEEDIDAAFETYNQAIVDILQQEFPADAGTIANISSQINSIGGAKAALKTTITVSADTDVIIEAYSTFYASVRATVDTLFTAATNTEAAFVTEVMILINLAN